MSRTTISNKMDMVSIFFHQVSLTTRHLVSHLGGIRHYDKSYMKKKKKTDEKETDKDKQKDKRNKHTEKGVTLQKHQVNETTMTKDKEKNEENITMKSEAMFDEIKSKKEFKTVTSALDLFKDDPLMHKPGKDLHFACIYMYVPMTSVKCSKSMFISRGNSALLQSSIIMLSNYVVDRSFLGICEVSMHAITY